MFQYGAIEYLHGIQLCDLFSSLPASDTSISSDGGRRMTDSSRLVINSLIVLVISNASCSSNVQIQDLLVIQDDAGNANSYSHAKVFS